jgi:hypothetical protein
VQIRTRGISWDNSAIYRCWSNSGTNLKRADYRPAMTQAQKILMWLLLMALAALVSYFSFRGYLSPEFLIGFANSLYC